MRRSARVIGRRARHARRARLRPALRVALVRRELGQRGERPQRHRVDESALYRERVAVVRAARAERSVDDEAAFKEAALQDTACAEGEGRAQCPGGRLL
eukprot:3215845-Prymnesium_polylepis.1